MQQRIQVFIIESSDHWNETFEGIKLFFMKNVPVIVLHSLENPLEESIIKRFNAWVYSNEFYEEKILNSESTISIHHIQHLERQLFVLGPREYIDRGIEEKLDLQQNYKRTVQKIIDFLQEKELSLSTSYQEREKLKKNLEERLQLELWKTRGLKWYWVTPGHLQEDEEVLTLELKLANSGQYRFQSNLSSLGVALNFSWDIQQVFPKGLELKPEESTGIKREVLEVQPFSELSVFLTARQK